MGWAGLLPPPKIFSIRFFFLGGVGSVVSGDCGLTWGVGAAFGLAVPPENRRWIRVCGDAPIWLQVLLGTVPSRNAKE